MIAPNKPNKPNKNVENLKWAYGLWIDTRGDSVEAWLTLISDDFIVRSAADSYIAAAFGAAPRGKEGARWYLRAMIETWEMQLYEVQRYVADGDEVAVLAEVAYRHRKTNRIVGSQLANFWSFRDGKAVSMIELFDTEAVVAASQPS